MKWFFPLVLALTGCAHSLSTADAERLPGVYSNGDGFWPRWLELNVDGSYEYAQRTDEIESAPGGGFVSKGGWSFTGHWTFVPPDRIELLTDGKPERISVFVRKSVRYEFAILEPDLFSNIVSKWKDDGGLRYLKKQKRPNQSVQPTPGSVTPRAKESEPR